MALVLPLTREHVVRVYVDREESAIDLVSCEENAWQQLEKSIGRTSPSFTALPAWVHSRAVSISKCMPFVSLFLQLTTTHTELAT
jgi:hypothetical protein